MATMITRWFQSTKPKYTTPAVVGNVHHLQADEFQANKLNMGVQEFRRRRSILESTCRRLDEKKWHIGSKLFPATRDNFKNHGEVEICGIARTMNQYGIITWDDMFPRIIRVRVLNQHSSYLDCPIEWLSDTQPEEPQQC